MNASWDRSGIAFDPETWKAALKVLKPGGHMLAFGAPRNSHRLATAIEDAGFEIRDTIMWIYGQGMPKGGSNLKPAYEPIIVARKPLSGTVKETVPLHGTGALQIEACRVEPSGRWPANVITDGSEAVTDLLPTSKDGVAGKRSGVGSIGPLMRGYDHVWGGYGGEGSAARFFYCAKASKADRCESKHPTVKPQKLMRYLVRLVTPPGGTVLDPFAGSGSTLQAARDEGFKSIGIELQPEYAADIVKRLNPPE